MFRILPTQRRQRHALLLFPFQAYPIIAFCGYIIIRGILPHGKASTDQLQAVASYLVLGSLASVIVLTLAIVANLSGRKYNEAVGNFAFALLDVVVVLLRIPSFVSA